MVQLMTLKTTVVVAVVVSLLMLVVLLVLLVLAVLFCWWCWCDVVYFICLCYCSLATNLTRVLEQISHCAGLQVLRLSTMETSSRPLLSIFKNSTALKELYMERVRFVNTVSCLLYNVCVYHVASDATTSAIATTGTMHPP